GDQPGDVRHVGHHRGPDAIGGRAHAGEVEHARGGTGTDDDQLGFVLVGETIERVVIESLVFLAHAVRHDVEETAGEVQCVAVRKVAAVRQIHAKHRVARLQQ